MNTKQLLAAVAMLTATGVVLAASDYTAPDEGFVSTKTRAQVIESFAGAAPQGVQTVALKDGSTVYVFNDGKMGMEDKYGRASRMGEGHLMETKSGQKITMIGNETARTDNVLHAQYYGN